jgi:hypothetical protein
MATRLQPRFVSATGLGRLLNLDRRTVSSRIRSGALVPDAIEGATQLFDVARISEIRAQVARTPASAAPLRHTTEGRS